MKNTLSKAKKYSKSNNSNRNRFRKNKVDNDVEYCVFAIWTNFDDPDPDDN